MMLLMQAMALLVIAIHELSPLLLAFFAVVFIFAARKIFKLDMRMFGADKFLRRWRRLMLMSAAGLALLGILLSLTGCEPFPGRCNPGDIFCMPC